MMAGGGVRVVSDCKEVNCNGSAAGVYSFGELVSQCKDDGSSGGVCSA